MTQELLAQLADALLNQTIRVVDLTQTLSPSTPVIKLRDPFRQSAPFVMDEVSRYDEHGANWYWNNLSFGEHTGTHFDAPVHWRTGKDYADGATDTIPPQRLVAPACVIDCSAEAAANPDFLLEPDHVEAWEAVHGRIPSGSWLLMRSDWSRKASAKEFLNIGDDGAHVPGPSARTMRFLVDERDVNGWGVESVGTDAGQGFRFDPPSPAHAIMHGANKFGLASLCNLDQLPPTGSLLITPPLKILHGSGSPTRVLALVST